MVVCSCRKEDQLFVTWLMFISFGSLALKSHKLGIKVLHTVCDPPAPHSVSIQMIISSQVYLLHFKTKVIKDKNNFKLFAESYVRKSFWPQTYRTMSSFCQRSPISLSFLSSTYNILFGFFFLVSEMLINSRILGDFISMAAKPSKRRTVIYYPSGRSFFLFGPLIRMRSNLKWKFANHIK